MGVKGARMISEALKTKDTLTAIDFHCEEGKAVNEDPHQIYLKESLKS